MQTTRSTTCFSLWGTFNLKTQINPLRMGAGGMGWGGYEPPQTCSLCVPAVPVGCEEWRGKQQMPSCGDSDWEITAREGWEPNTHAEMSRSPGTHRDAPLLSWTWHLHSHLISLSFSSLLHKMFILWHSRWGLTGLVICLPKTQSCSGALWDHSTAAEPANIRVWPPAPPASTQDLGLSSTQVLLPQSCCLTWWVYEFLLVGIHQIRMSESHL